MIDILNTEQRHSLINLHAALALREIEEMAGAATEHMNRKIGQHMRYHMARIELARREFGHNAKVTGSHGPQRM